MAQMPDDPRAFLKRVFQIVEELQPKIEKQIVNPSSFTVVLGGKRFHLDSLHRLVKLEPDSGEEIAREYLAQLFNANGLEDSILSFSIAESKIMPRLYPLTIFERWNNQQMAHIPFVNGTVVVFVLDMPHLTVSITDAQCISWGVTVEDLDQIARKNLGDYQPVLEPKFIEVKGRCWAAQFSEVDGYDSSRLLLTGLHDRLAPELGRDFYVAVPARDSFLAFSSKEPQGLVQDVKRSIQEEYSKLPFPITKELFLVTRDGVAGTW